MMNLNKMRIQNNCINLDKMSKDIARLIIENLPTYTSIDLHRTIIDIKSKKFVPSIIDYFNTIVLERTYQNKYETDMTLNLNNFMSGNIGIIVNDEILDICDDSFLKYIVSDTEIHSSLIIKTKSGRQLFDYCKKLNISMCAKNLNNYNHRIVFNWKNIKPIDNIAEDKDTNIDNITNKKDTNIEKPRQKIKKYGWPLKNKKT